MSYPSRYSDEQLLAIMRASVSETAALAERFGMAVSYAHNIRQRHSKRCMRLARQFGLPEKTVFRPVQWAAAIVPEESHDLIRRIQAGDA